MYLEEAEQQVRLWLRLAYEAYGEGQVMRAFHYFRRALNYAEERGQYRELALVCRDLGYVYARQGSLDEALACFDQGLAAAETDLSTRTGIMANKASVLTHLGAYRAALALLEQSAGLIRSNYSDFSKAPGQLVQSYAAISRMAADLQKVVGLLDMGVRADRIQVEIKRYDPPWLS